MRLRTILLLLVLPFFAACHVTNRQEKNLADKILQDNDLDTVVTMAENILKGGFSAGDGYKEIWIRDFNTFMDLALEVHDKEMIREKLLIFFDFQGEDGNIIDAYIPKEKITPGGYNYIYSDLQPGLAAHKNNVETDQESSLIQAIHKYIRHTGDKEILNLRVAGETIVHRMEKAMQYLMDYRYNDRYGLIYGATTADWGDVQPETRTGVVITDSTHYAIDIYDNAMLVIALKNFLEIVPESTKKWKPILERLENNIREYLWDNEKQKFHPHLYLDGSPFPPDYDEDMIYYQGGTAVAIEAGLLTKEEVKTSLDKMIANVRAAEAASIGLSLYPAYPEGFFKHPMLNKPYTYQNGGDWTWFGARMIQQLVNYGLVGEAYEQIQPFLERVIKNDGFYEWYTLDNQPRGSSSYRGSAGVLYDAIVLLKKWAEQIQ